MRSDDPESVVRALGLRTVLPSNWAGGLAEVEHAGVFATPPVDGWVLVVGRDLMAATRDPVKVEALMMQLGDEFGAARWFATDEERDFHGWARVERRELVRGYAFSGEHGHIWFHGEVTDAEHELACFVDDPRDQSDDDVKWWPDRAIVMALARAWAVDPSTLSSRELPCDTGWVGRM